MDLFDIAVAKKLSGGGGGGGDTYTKWTVEGTMANIIKQSGMSGSAIASLILSGKVKLSAKATLGTGTATFVCYTSDGRTVSTSLTFGTFSSTAENFRTYYARWDGTGTLVTFSLLTGADDKSWSETDYLPMANMVNCTAEIVLLGSID